MMQPALQLARTITLHPHSDFCSVKLGPNLSTLTRDRTCSCETSDPPTMLHCVKTQITIWTVPAMKTWTHTAVILTLWFYSVRKNYLKINWSLFKDITSLFYINSYHYDYNNKGKARSHLRQNLSVLPYTLHLPTFTSITTVKIKSWLRKKKKTIFWHPPFAESTIQNDIYTHPNYPSV